MPATSRSIAAPALAIAVLALTMTPSRIESQAPAIARAADGKPDLSGIWQAVTSAAWDIQDHHAQRGVPAGPGVVDGGEIPYQPWAAAKKRENYEHRATADPDSKCYLPGVPRLTYMPYPFQIVQAPSQVTMLYEYAHVFRNIYLDSAHPKGPIQWWMGDSRAKWEGDTLVVDVIHFTDQTWFDRSGNFHSPALHVVERYTRTSPDHLLYEATIEDPDTFSKPWTISMPLYRRQERNIRVLEYECYAYLETQRDAR